MAFVEIPSLRTAKTKTFQDNIDPTKFQSIITISDQYYLSGSAWQDIDTSLIDDTSVQGFDKSNNKTRHVFRIGQGGTYRWYPRRTIDTEYIDITNIQYWRPQGGGQWRNLNLPSVVWKSNGAEWDLSNLYASIENGWRKIKSTFILKDSTAYTQLRFEISFIGLTLNGWDLISNSDSKIVGRIDPVTAVDANDIDIPVTQTYDGTYITWSVDITGAIFPVNVDPTFTDQGTTAFDTYCRSGGNSGNNFGTSDQLKTQSGNYSSQLYFDVSSLFGYTVTSGSLSLYTYNSLSGRISDGFPILSANSGWTELGACWDTLDGTNAWAGGNTGCTTAGTDYDNSGGAVGSWTSTGTANQEVVSSITTSVLQAWIDGSNYGLVLIANSSLPTWFSSDDSGGGYEPKLVIDYSTGGGSGSITVQDLNQEQTIDTAVLTQHNVLIVDNLDQNQNIDVLSFVQHNILSIDDLQESQSLGATFDLAQFQSIEEVYLILHVSLETNNVDQSQSIDTIELTQHNNLEVNNLFQSSNIDNVDLVFHNVLIVLDLQESQNVGSTFNLTQFQSIETIYLSFQINFIANNLDQSQSIDSISLIENYNLLVDNLSQSNAINNIELTQAAILKIENNDQVQNLDNGIVLIQHYILNVQELNQVEAIEQIGFVQHNNLLIDNLSQLDTIENINFTQSSILAVDNINQTQNLNGGLALIQHNILLINDLNQVQSIETLGFTQHNILQTDNISQEQSISNIILVYHSPGAFYLILHNLSQDENIDNTALVQHNILLVNNLNQSEQIDLIELIQHGVLSVQDIGQTIFIDSVSFSQNNILVIADLQQLESIDTLGLIQHNILIVKNIDEIQSIDNIDLTYHSPGAFTLSLQSINQSESIDSYELIQHNILLADNILHSSNIEIVEFIQHYFLASIDSLDQDIYIDYLAFIQNNVLIIQDVDILQTIDQIELIQHNNLLLSGLNQFQVLDNANVLTNYFVLQISNIDQEQSIENIVLTAYLLYGLIVLSSSQDQSIDSISLTYHSIFEGVITPWQRTYIILNEYRESIITQDNRNYIILDEDNESIIIQDKRNYIILDEDRESIITK